MPIRKGLATAVPMAQGQHPSVKTLLLDKIFCFANEYSVLDFIFFMPARK